jgi:hypothetical protein
MIRERTVQKNYERDVPAERGGSDTSLGLTFSGFYDPTFFNPCAIR